MANDLLTEIVPYFDGEEIDVTFSIDEYEIITFFIYIDGIRYRGPRITDRNIYQNYLFYQKCKDRIILYIQKEKRYTNVEVLRIINNMFNNCKSRNESKLKCKDIYDRFDVYPKSVYSFTLILYNLGINIELLVFYPFKDAIPKRQLRLLLLHGISSYLLLNYDQELNLVELTKSLRF